MACRVLDVERMHSVVVRSLLQSSYSVRRDADMESRGLTHCRFTNRKILVWRVCPRADGVGCDLSPVSVENGAQFSCRHSYVVLVRCQQLRDCVYIWHGWRVSHVDGLSWQHNIFGTLSGGSSVVGHRALQVVIRQGREPLHFLQL